MTDTSAYHVKALPVGTVLREWRLDGLLGSGGFGIVYKGTGVYFNETVAIKEYFPSSISNRIDGMTVAPNDASSAEIYKHGLQKFVEEAKILWNLSQPERHPNIVCVRSLFEIHGTAYMVMDFEEGVSLSQMLKERGTFDEKSLVSFIRPIAEGLERAHVAGVYHRDIKPANILMTPDGRPVLIDFGSARFDSGDATSTKVTFYTPPYAALEQYVRTFPQGPWTDIYALGVTMYQCVTGEKPAEVLERLHGAAETPLAERNLPGYSPDFLRAIDAAMGIKPEERPQSIGAWLAMFANIAAADNEETRVAAPSPAAAKRAAQALAAKPAAKAAPKTAKPAPRKGSALKPLWIGAAVGALALVLAGGALFVLQPWRNNATTAALSAPEAQSEPFSKRLAALVQRAAANEKLAAKSPMLDTAAQQATQLELTAASAQAANDQAGAAAAKAQLESGARDAVKAYAAALIDDTTRRGGKLKKDLDVAAQARTSAGTASEPAFVTLQDQLAKIDADSAAIVAAKDQVLTADQAFALAERAQDLSIAIDAATPGVWEEFTVVRRKEFAKVTVDCRRIANEILSVANVSKPSLFAGKAKKDAYALLQEYATLARSSLTEVDALAANLKGSDRNSVDRSTTDATRIRANLRAALATSKNAANVLRS